MARLNDMGLFDQGKLNEFLVRSGLVSMNPADYAPGAAGGGIDGYVGAGGNGQGFSPIPLGPMPGIGDNTEFDNWLAAQKYNQSLVPDPQEAPDEIALAKLDLDTQRNEREAQEFTQQYGDPDNDLDMVMRLYGFSNPAQLVEVFDNPDPTAWQGDFEDIAGKMFGDAYDPADPYQRNKIMGLRDTALSRLTGADDARNEAYNAAAEDVPLRQAYLDTYSPEYGMTAGLDQNWFGPGASERQQAWENRDLSPEHLVRARAGAREGRIAQAEKVKAERPDAMTAAGAFKGMESAEGTIPFYMSQAWETRKGKLDAERERIAADKALTPGQRTAGRAAAAVTPRSLGGQAGSIAPAGGASAFAANLPNYVPANKKRGTTNTRRS